MATTTASRTNPAAATTTTATTRSTKSILLLGAAELGSAILNALLRHPFYSRTTFPLTLTMTPSTLASPPASRLPLITLCHANSVSLQPLDLTTATHEELVELFQGYWCVIHAAGMAAPGGTQKRITEAVMEAGVARYCPWQWGVDYDTIGGEAGAGLFAEQVGVRKLLRSQEPGTGTKWLVVSCGIFMSFLFEEVWGVVLPEEDGKIRVRALGSWGDGVTATTAEDIGRAAAELVLDDEESKWWEEGENKVFIAGDTLTYGELAGLVERVTGKEVVRELWDRERFEEELRKNPEDKLWKYRTVFGGGKGVSWPLEGTWSEKKGMKMTGVEEWLRMNWKA